jgi:hypothetical protein
MNTLQYKLDEIAINSICARKFRAWLVDIQILADKIKAS